MHVNMLHMMIMPQVVLSSWAVPCILLMAALAVNLYARFEFNRMEGSALLSLSAYMAAVVLSIVSLVYVLVLPVQLEIAHKSWGGWDTADLSVLLICAVILTYFSWSGMHKTSDDL